MKSSVVSLMGLYGRGELTTPLRIRVPAIVGGDLKPNFLINLLLLGFRRSDTIHNPAFLI